MDISLKMNDDLTIVISTTTGGYLGWGLNTSALYGQIGGGAFPGCIAGGNDRSRNYGRSGIDTFSYYIHMVIIFEMCGNTS